MFKTFVYRHVFFSTQHTAVTVKMLSHFIGKQPALKASTRLIRLASTSGRSTTASVDEVGSAGNTGVTSFKTVKVIDTQYDDKPNVVILGSGWGAISFLKHIDTKQYNVSIISPRNYFLFTPLLPSTPVGTVDEKSIIEPVVNFALKKKGNVSYLSLIHISEPTRH